jgi:hypothetical protein
MYRSTRGVPLNYFLDAVGPRTKICSFAPKICPLLPWTEKAPTIKGRGKLGRVGVSDQFGPSHSASHARAERFLVALPTSKDLSFRAKDLFVGAKHPVNPVTACTPPR